MADDIGPSPTTWTPLPLGYPAERNRYGPTNRRPVEEVAFAETWGKPWHA